MNEASQHAQVRIEELDHGALAEDAPLREYICALGVHDQDPQSLRTFLCQNGWPQKQSVSDLGIERVGLGPLQWWRPLGTFYTLSQQLHL